jgi:hypothetical protein
MLIVDFSKVEADVRLTPLIGRNRPKADIRLWYNLLGQVNYYGTLALNYLLYDPARGEKSGEILESL